VSQGTTNLGTRGPRTFVRGHIVLGCPVTPPSLPPVLPTHNISSKLDSLTLFYKTTYMCMLILTGWCLISCMEASSSSLIAVSKVLSFFSHSKLCRCFMQKVEFTPKKKLIDPPLHVLNFCCGKRFEVYAQHTHTGFLTVSYDEKNKCSRFGLGPL